MQTSKEQRKQKRLSKISKRLTLTKNVSKLFLLILLVPMLALSACQTQSRQVTSEPSPTLIFNEQHLDSQETYSSRAAQNIATWQNKLTELQTAYEQQSKQIVDE